MLDCGTTLSYVEVEVRAPLTIDAWGTTATDAGHIYIQTHASMYMYVCIYAYVHMHIYMYICIHIYIYIYIYM